MSTINWLHLTDLHLGLDEQNWAWPQMKHEFLRDLASLTSKVGLCDLVFFTGDFVQSGNRKEYDQLNRLLEEIWEVLTKSGGMPQLCAVPGNHDLVRPDAKLPSTKALKQLWFSDPEIRDEFWREPECAYRKAVAGSFENYSEWLRGVSVPVLPCQPGVLAGDFVSTYVKDEIRLGIAGLNTTFLQLVSGDRLGKLDVHSSQLSVACGGDIDAWTKNHTACILLTHQPPNWLSDEARDRYRQDIYPAGRFLANFCGHQHNPESHEHGEGGGERRNMRHGASLFGLERWDGGGAVGSRIHGYTAGQYHFAAGGISEKYWPRITHKKLDGTLKLGPDLRFNLQDGDYVVARLREPGHEQSGPDEGWGDDTEGDMSGTGLTADRFAPLQLLMTAHRTEEADKRRAAFPRLNLRFGPQHRFVRQEEQSQCESALRKVRKVWLAADWATEEGFIAACVDRFRTQSRSPDVYQLRCDEASDLDTFELLFPQQFGCTMPAAFTSLSAAKDCFLLLDGVHPSLCAGDDHLRLQKIVAAVVDYCVDLRVVVISRRPPEAADIPTVLLHGLDQPDVKAYLENHPDAEPWMSDGDVVDRLHERSDGRPVHIDRLLKALSVSSLDLVLADDMENPTTAMSDVPKGLANAVASLSGSSDPRTFRSYRLLQVLSLLPYGETLEALRRYLPTEPFFEDNAIQLKDLALLDIISGHQARPGLGKGPASATGNAPPKLLKAPRQVRDHVQVLLSQDDRKHLVSAGLGHFFGKSWREGKVKLRTIPVQYREYLTVGTGNEFALLHHYISQTAVDGDIVGLNHGMQLGIYYLDSLIDAHRYRDAVIVAKGLLQLLDREHYPDEWIAIALVLGRSLRMTGAKDDAIEYLTAAIEHPGLSPWQLASAWLNVALIEQSRRDGVAAVAAAEEVIRISKASSSANLQAKVVLADLSLCGDEKTAALVKYEKRARSKGHMILAEVITLNLAEQAASPKEKNQHYDKVLSTRPFAYNQARASVSKAQLAGKTNQLASLTAADIHHLGSAYSYFHAQRFESLFDRCHESLWSYFEYKDDTAQLLRIFRHSSFLWRLRGEDSKESEYLEKLQAVKVATPDQGQAGGLLVEIKYFLGRLASLITSGESVG